VFVITSLIFIVIIYFVYAISLPNNMSQQFNDIFYFIAIFEIIVSLLLMCSLMLYVKRIIFHDPQYGKHAFILGAVFIVANILSGGVNFYVGSGGWQTLFNLKCQHTVVWCILFIPYYIITEFAPAIAFAFVM
jgi:hypothetical protein